VESAEGGKEGGKGGGRPEELGAVYLAWGTVEVREGEVGDL